MHDFSNPEVAKHLQFYPEETGGPVSEVWQAERWKEFKPSELMPMYSRGLRQFYIEELAQLRGGTFVIPHNWIICKGELHADCSEAFFTPDGRCIYSVERTVSEMPHPLHKLAQGDDLYVVMIPVWADDVLGNKSKQYNKHINLYMVNSCLPGQLLQQEYFICFVSTSLHTTSPEQFSALRDQVKDTEINPVRCFNAHTKWPCRFILRVPALPADNPQQSEEASHIGGNGNMGCRKCYAGGWHENMESNEGYHDLHYVCMFFTSTINGPDYCLKEGVFRTTQEIREQLEKQIHQAMHGVEKTVSDMQTATGIKDKVAQHWIELLLAKEKEMKHAQPGRSLESVAEELQKWFDEQPGDEINPLLDIARLDPSQDTPVEILHTILLGIIKYIWHMLHTSMTDAHLVKAAGTLGTLLWVHEIENMDEYLKDLETLIGNVLDAFGDVNPSKILIKVKLHLLPHLITDIQRFGPAIRNLTEVFECYNAIFQLCSIYSNHQALSRDIAVKFCSMDHLKHLISRGYYWSESHQRWVQARNSVLQLLHSEPVIQQHLGWVAPIKLTPELICIKSKKKAVPVEWSTTKASSYFSGSEYPSSTSHWCHGISVTAQSGDHCSIRSWVVYSNNAVSGIGRIVELLIHETESLGSLLVFLECFVLGDARHPNFDCPILRRANHSDGNNALYIKGLLGNPQAVQFIISVQHDCHLIGCQASLLQPQLQEHQLTERTSCTLSHADDDHFVINVFALHNAILLQKFLPCSLTEPKPLYMDRQSHHAVKRAHMQEKWKVTLAMNKARKDAAEAATRRTVFPDEDVGDEVELRLKEEESGENNEMQPQRSQKRAQQG
ncbi:hypothetical protein ARMGADRAFT_1047955 [Armillaria gallica]|uniref:Uncharacterized protein n=1 Tax=Armillaria gallica TaxID=47427 RepID=A0A2H3CSJ4_ARMGA|nr:hypothetical protein ARMGADRAFT_1047955 [Armillaria gallica]